MKRLILTILSVLTLCGCGGTTKSGIIYQDDFEKGYVKEWTGGELQNQYTYESSKYAFKGVPENSDFVPMEVWKKYSVNNKTKLSFAYFCENVDDIIVNIWSAKHKKNYSLTIRKPAPRQWFVFTEELEAFGPDIGNAINSIHISVPNRNNPLIVIDNVKLYNE